MAKKRKVGKKAIRDVQQIELGKNETIIWQEYKNPYKCIYNYKTQYSKTIIQYYIVGQYIPTAEEKYSSNLKNVPAESFIKIYFREFSAGIY